MPLDPRPFRRGDPLRYRDEQFAERLERISGFTAVIFQHEIDHLDGILYTDRMERELRQEE